MRCIVCNAPAEKGTEIVDTRHIDDNGAYILRRKRKCKNCGSTFLTLEFAASGRDSQDIRVIKRDNSLESFDFKKIRDSLRKSFVKRGQTDEEISKVTALISAEVMNLVNRKNKSGRGTIASEEIGKLVLRELFLLDQVAYVRYLAHFDRDYESLEDFKRILGSHPSRLRRKPRARSQAK